MPAKTLAAVEQLEQLAESARRARPVALAGERVLPLAAPLEPLLAGGLRRGTSLQVTGVRAGVGSTSLALAVLAAPSAAGSWTSAIGMPSLGLAAAEGFGVDLDRFVLVADVGDLDRSTWATVVATLLDAFDVVVARPHGRVPLGTSRRLTARARERGAVLVRLGSPADWPESADATLTVVSTAWEGLGRGHGHLRARRAVVEATGRRGLDRPRRTTLWLPGPGGVLATDVHQPDASVLPMHTSQEGREREAS